MYRRLQCGDVQTRQTDNLTRNCCPTCPQPSPGLDALAAPWAGDIHARRRASACSRPRPPRTVKRRLRVMRATPTWPNRPTPRSARSWRILRHQTSIRATHSREYKASGTRARCRPSARGARSDPGSSTRRGSRPDDGEGSYRISPRSFVSCNGWQAGHTNAVRARSVMRRTLPPHDAHWLLP